MRYFLCDRFFISKDEALSEEELVCASLSFLYSSGAAGALSASVAKLGGNLYSVCMPVPIPLTEQLLSVMVNSLDENGEELEDYQLCKLMNSREYNECLNSLCKAKESGEDYAPVMLGGGGATPLDLDEPEEFETTGNSSTRVVKRRLKDPFFKKFMSCKSALKQVSALHLSDLQLIEMQGSYYLVTSELRQETALEFEFECRHNFIAFLLEHGQVIFDSKNSGIGVQEFLECAL